MTFSSHYYAFEVDIARLDDLCIYHCLDHLCLNIIPKERWIQPLLCFWGWHCQDGKIWSAGGVTSGIDVALAFLAARWLYIQHHYVKRTNLITHTRCSHIQSKPKFSKCGSILSELICFVCSCAKLSQTTSKDHNVALTIFKGRKDSGRGSPAQVRYLPKKKNSEIHLEDQTFLLNYISTYTFTYMYYIS